MTTITALVWALWMTTPNGPEPRAFFRTQESCEATMRVFNKRKFTGICLPGDYVIPVLPTNERKPL